jgi:hypothetical protein
MGMPAKQPKPESEREKKRKPATRVLKDWAALVLRSRESPSLAPRKERDEPDR